MTREERVARNEALFREVNERIKDVNEDAPASAETDFVCECGDPECTEPVSLTLIEYEEVRSDPTDFAVLPGHVVADVEVVIARNDRFAVVRKNDPQAARIAVREDPRS
ncbi:MAG TPA: hypothetical protein VD769_06900 [Gaiellaceae bacterium]|nr:hypothetical protein [Gaiellaceae bacterium]